MPDFSFPAWLTQQHSFADSLAKGAAVGSAIANNRYRNQALAAQAIDAERGYALRERSLQVDQEQKDIMIKSKLLEMETNKQMLADQVSDKETLSSWIAERNQLSPEERLNMSIPSLRLPASFNAANQIFDNDRLAYQQSLAGKAQTALALRLGKIDADYVQQYIDEPDPTRKREILAIGEAATAAKAEALRAVAPTIAAESRETIAKFKAGTQENLVKLRGDINFMRDQLKIDAASDLEDQRQLGRLEVLGQRYENLTALQEDSQEFKSEFAKLQNDLAMARDTSKAGLQAEAAKAKQYGVTEESFISRNLKTIFEDLSSTREHKKKSIEDRTQIATDILRKAYRGSDSKPAPSVSAAPDPSSKAALANKLAAEHPDWDRARIISEVNKQLP